jgi:hypothetical protein
VTVHEREFLGIGGEPSFWSELVWVFEDEFISVLDPAVDGNGILSE